MLSWVSPRYYVVKWASYGNVGSPGAWDTKRKDKRAEDGILSCSGCRNKTPDWGLKPHTFTFSQFWRLEAPDQGASKFCFWWELSSWLADCHLPAVSSCGPSSECALGERGPGTPSLHLLLRTPSPSSEGPALMTSFNPITSLMAPSSNTVPLKVVKASTYGQNSVYNRQPRKLEGMQGASSAEWGRSQVSDFDHVPSNSDSTSRPRQGQIPFFWRLNLIHTILEALFKTKYKIRYRVLEGACANKGLWGLPFVNFVADSLLLFMQLSKLLNLSLRLAFPKCKCR